MPFGKGRRKLLQVLGFLLTGVAALWLLLPVWFPWVLRPLAARAGVRYSAYNRLGYSRFALHRLDFTNESIVIGIQRLDAFVPSVWLWKMVASRNAASKPFLQVDDWHCELLPSRDTNSYPLFSQIQDAATVLRTVKRWIPKAVLSNGSLHSGDLILGIPEATWIEGSIQARAKLPAQAANQILEVKLTPARPFDLQMDCPAFRLNSSLTLSTNQGGFDLQNITFWRSNRFELMARFGRSDDLPATATLRSANFRLPGDVANLPQYHELTGSLFAQWERGQFGLDLSASGHPAATETNFPPVDIDLHARGDTNSATIDKLVLKTPFLQATLSNTVRLSRDAPYLRGPATLTLMADLGHQQWVPIPGKLGGSIIVSSLTTNFAPLAQIHVTGSDIGSVPLKASSLDLSAAFEWPLLQIAQAEAHFADGSAAVLSGKVDLQKKTADAGQFRFGGPLARQWLPPGYSYGNVSVSGSFHGPLDKPASEGRVEAAQVTTPVLRPVDLSASWSGEGKTIQHLTVLLSNTNSSIELQGALNANAQHFELKVTSLSLATNRIPALTLTAPATIDFTPSKSDAGWSLATTPIQWAGPGGQIAAQAVVEWPIQGAVQLSAKHISLGLVGGLLQTAAPQLDITQLEGSGHWSNGPAIFQLDFAGSGFAKLPENGRTNAQTSVRNEGTSPTQAVSAQAATEQILTTPLNIEIKLNGDAQGIVLSNLVVNTATSAVVVAHGFLPVTITPAAPTNIVNFEMGEPLLVNASLRPEAFFWENLAALSGVRLQEPDVDLNLSGIWNAPQGQITFQARSIQFQQASLAKLGLEDLHLSLAVDRESARLTEGRFRVQGQQVDLSGELPLGESFWRGLLEKKPPDWQKATARVRIQEAQLAAFEPLFPELLAPQGELDLDLAMLPGARLEGALLLRHARTRPLGNTAPFRDINLTMRFQDRILALENASAKLGGAEIDLNGQVDLRGTNWLGGALPPFELTLRGTNVPLAREPDYIIRSDLDLALVKTNDAPPIVFGAAHPRDSFYLSDLSGLIPGGVAKPSSRPPYFSIDNPILANWRLAVTVDGVRWLKVRTSIFNGEVSANLHLQGSLKEPIALGGIKIDSGVVRFPFGTLQVQQGLVTLSSGDPYHPQLLVRAASKQFGYDIRMEVSGAVDAPIIQFTSNPALSSEQILLMITAGQMPQGTYTLTPQQRAQTVALFLGRDLLSKLGMGDQSQERLTIRSGEEVSEQGRPTYHVEYRVTKRWFVVGEYDRFGDFNGGFKWRIYSK